MGEFQATSSGSILEGEENLIATVKSIVKELETYKNLTNDARKILFDLGSQLITIATTVENTKDVELPSKIEIKQLNAVQGKVMKWEESLSAIEDYGPKDANEYLTERSENMDVTKDSGDDGLPERVDDMAKLKLEEFRNLLVWNKQPLKPKDPSRKDDSMNEGDIFFYVNREEDELFQKASDILPIAVHKTHHSIDNVSVVSSGDSEERELLQRARGILHTAVQRARTTVDDDSILSSEDSEDWCFHIHDFIQKPVVLEEFEQLGVQTGDGCGPAGTPAPAYRYYTRPVLPLPTHIYYTCPAPPLS